MKKIDAHVHVGDFGGWASVSMTAESLVGSMDEFDMERSILCGANQYSNDDVLNARERYPERILPLVWVDPLQGEEALQAVDRYVGTLRFAGIKMHPLFNAFVADDPIVDPVMRKAEEYGVPVFIHCGHPPFSLPWSIALLAERHPSVPTVMIHMGHGHGVYIQASIEMAKRYGNLYLEMSGMPMGSKILEAYRTVGADRVLFGTDGPFHHPSVEIQKVLTSGLSEREQGDVFYNNTAKLMKLP